MTADIIAGLVNLGVGGIILVLLIRGDLVPRATYEREIRRGDDATATTAKNSEALKTMTDAIVDLGQKLATRGQ